MADDQDPNPGDPPAAPRPRFPPRPGGEPGSVDEPDGAAGDGPGGDRGDERRVGAGGAGERRAGAGGAGERRVGDGGAGAGGTGADDQGDDPPQYTLYRSRRLPRRGPTGPPSSAWAPVSPQSGRRRLRGPAWTRRRSGRSRPVTFGRVVRWVLLAVVAWVVFSAILFVVSAHLAPSVSAEARATLSSSGWPLTSSNTILVLGSDQRPVGTHEAGANTSGPSRSDVMLLIRIGGGRSARLSIPRDTIVSIPGHGTTKINAAFAYGGAALATETVEQYLGVKVNHVVEVNFTNFPGLVNALGGVNYTGSCVVSKISGGFRNGGFTLRLKAGTTHIDGAQALALARTRENLCAPAESDLTRARRQQKLFSSIERRVISPAAFIRLPWVAWEAPRAIETDMGASTLLGLFAALETTGSPPTQVLEPSGGETLADGEDGLVVSAAERATAVATFLRG
jgi:LCP family protein required for cell wall assembly